MTLVSTFTPARPLVLVGAGKMGGALLAGWLQRGLDAKAVIVVDPSPPAEGTAFLDKAGVSVGPKPPSGIVFETSKSPSRNAGGSDTNASGEGPRPLSNPAGPTLPKGRVNVKTCSKTSKEIRESGL